MNDFELQMCSAGMTPAEASRKSAILNQLVRDLCALRAEQIEHPCALFVPGRVELVGKHTDYAGGRSLVCAIERGICLVAAPRRDARIRIRDVRRGSASEFAFDTEPQNVCGDISAHAVTVVRRVARDFPAARTGADIVFASDLPAASGMSSSSALVTGVFFAIASVNRLWQTKALRSVQTRAELAGYVAAVESGDAFASFSANRGVGTLGGSEDHVAILCSRAGFLRQYSYCPIRLETEVPMLREHSLVIGVSGVRAEKTGNSRDAYNRISIATRRILELWRARTGRDDGSLAAALASAPDAVDRLHEIICQSEESEVMREVLLNRLIQFAEESNEIVPIVTEAFAAENFSRLGCVVDRSQHLAEALLGNQTPETIELQRSARRLRAVAASAFGAGFGGSVWALVASNQAVKFRDTWAAHYRKRYPALADASEFLTATAGPALIQFE